MREDEDLKRQLQKRIILKLSKRVVEYTHHSMKLLVKEVLVPKVILICKNNEQKNPKQLVSIKNIFRKEIKYYNN